MTDCYQPIERKLRLTRGCLEVMLAARQAVGIITKNALIARDLDVLQALAAEKLVHVFISVTTLDGELARVASNRAPLHPPPGCARSPRFRPRACRSAS